MTEAERDWFDALVEEAIEALPEHIRSLIEQVPVIVLDEPTPEMLAELGDDGGDPSAYCGLHSGLPRTERSMDAPEALPNDIHLFREGIVAQGRRFSEGDLDDAVFEQIVTTLLHEIGHDLGLDEDDLDELGYG